jgi:hypothetical protein
MGKAARLTFQTRRLYTRLRGLHPVFRWLTGLALCVAGIVGFLPIVGFWMLPLGLVMLGTVVPPARRWLDQRLLLGHPGQRPAA